jgi:hypothetical protein
MFCNWNEISERDTQNELAVRVIQTPSWGFVKKFIIFMCRIFGTAVVKRKEWRFWNTVEPLITDTLINEHLQ